MIKMIVILLGMVLAACGSPDKNPYPTVSLIETDSFGSEVRRLSFALTSRPAKTCLNGDWKEAEALADQSKYTMRPAYIWRNDRLEILLINRFCDSYDSYIGTVEGSDFVGERVMYGRGSGPTVESKTTGTVSGSYSTP